MLHSRSSGEFSQMEMARRVPNASLSFFCGFLFAVLPIAASVDVNGPFLGSKPPLLWCLGVPLVSGCSRSSPGRSVLTSDHLLLLVVSFCAVLAVGGVSGVRGY